MGKVVELLNGDGTCDELKELKASIGCFVSEELDDYLLNLKEYVEYNKRIRGEKNFYDAVWGTIVINESEVRILNSPLLQRLRDVKQLGLADLLYSSANHSRFSHTIGVLNVSTQMCYQIQRELGKLNVTIDKTEKQIIRLAAIFHDVGHMFCSHASERYFQSNPKASKYQFVTKIRNEFRKKLLVKPSFSEIISVLIVASEPVERMLDILKDGLEDFDFTNKRDKKKTIERICCLILGIPYTKKSLPYSQIISGNIDADKLDYLKRDSHMTGVPVAVDMSRIFQKLRVVVPHNTVRNFVEADPGDGNKGYVMGIAPAAVNTIDQLVMSRFMMYENIYFHQKVLTAEEMLRYAIECLDTSSKGVFDDFTVIMRITDSVIINNDFNIALRQVCNNSNIIITDKSRFNLGCRILSQIKNRMLFKRCLSIDYECLTSMSNSNVGFYDKLFVNSESAKKDEFVNSVREEIKNIKELLKGSDVYFNENTDLLLICLPDPGESVSDSNIAIADRKSRNRNEVFMADRWLLSRTTRKTQNYLITNEEDRFIGYIAAEKVLYAKYGLRIVDMDIFDQEDDQEIDRIKNIIKKKGYYHDAFALIPDTLVQLRSDIVNELINKWHTYLRFDIEAAKRKPIDATFLSDYIMQFYQFESELGDFEIFVDGCLDLLSNVRIITRDDILGALIECVKKIAEEVSNNDLVICNLGTVQDSGAQISYQFNEINALSSNVKLKYSVHKIEELSEVSIKKAILFIEDAFSSAKQIVSIFEEYMGVPISQRQTKEHHGKELTEQMKQKLKQSDLYFSFIFYNKDNEEYFTNQMRRLGLEKIHIISHEQFPKGYFTYDHNVEDGERKEITKKYFEAAGKMLIEQKAYDEKGELKPSWNSDRMRHSILGYNDAQQLIVFPWNTPTYTVTALWMQSKNNKWHPLFQRIDK